MSPPWEKYAAPEKSGPWAKYALPDKPQPMTYDPAGGAGVQDWTPATAPQPEPTIMERINTGVNWLGTRATKAATGFAGQARGMADLVEAVALKFGVDQRTAKMMLASNPITAVGQFMPSTGQMNEAVFQGAGVPEVNLPGKIGKAVDIGVETALQTPAFPGSVARNVLPAFVGGAAQEVAGQAVEGTPWEIPVRVGAGMVAGGGTALAQNAAGNVLKGATNVVGANARNTDTQAARILGRALERDKTDFNALAAAREQFPEGAPLVVAGGENVRGAVRGSTAAPGPARTTVADAAENYLIASDKRAGAAIGQNVSDLPPVSSRVNALTEQRAAAAGPAYEAAGIPQNRADLKSADKLLMSDDLLGLFKDSPDVQAALRNARRVPELKGEPINSMAVLDRVYKHLEGLEQAARRAGNNMRAGDLADIRKRFAAGIDMEKPQYGEARAAFSEPSKLIDAATLGRDAFAKNVAPDEVKRVFEKLPPDQQTEYLGGVADFLRTKAGNTDRATAAERIWNNQNIRERLKAILPAERYEAFAKAMDTDKTAAKALRSITQGSRTTPMAMEAGDNAEMTTNVLSKLFQGRPIAAALDASNAITGRIAEGRTQAVNERLAQWLMENDPQKIGLVKALAERARLEEAARRSGRMNALATGAILPAAAGTR